ncbi:hypothetical protein [Methanobrevibacter sp.]|uniref:hypothetical protein n=1 Tax=Methanobrevibacter sp. TaxID=66852 RepID=UPI0038904762
MNLDIKGRVYFKYTIETSPDLDKYFRNKQQHVKIIHGDEKVAKIPDSILILPVITNFIPVAWFFDAELIVDELDETFYNCLDNIKKSYKKMYPLAEFKGKITANKLVNNSYEPSDTYISLFSQGVDSLYTVCENFDKKLHLVTVYGADIPLGKKEGWKNLSNTITEFSNSMHLNTSFIETSFYSCLNQDTLTDEIQNVASSGWWHQFQHGLVFLGHSALIAYVHKAKGILISSSHSPKESEFFKKDIMQCASSPITDNEFKFASCNVTHFGYEVERFEKIEAIVNYSKKHNLSFPLKVCFTSKEGGNCSICDKCSRCIMSLIALKENPEDYGFKITDETFIKIQENLIYIENGINKFGKGWNIPGVKIFDWFVIQENFNKDREYWNDNPDINWILDYNFDKIKKIKYDYKGNLH